MKEEEQKRAIAEAVNFDLYVIVKTGYYYRPNASGYTSDIRDAWKLPYEEAKKYEMYAGRDDVSVNEKVLIEKAPLPDYLNDLNAMDEIEGTLPQTKHYYPYYENLYSITGACMAFGLRATASQRAEAFLRAIGKWKED